MGGCISSREEDDGLIFLPNPWAECEDLRPLGPSFKDLRMFEDVFEELNCVDYEDGFVDFKLHLCSHRKTGKLCTLMKAPKWKSDWYDAMTILHAIGNHNCITSLSAAFASRKEVYLVLDHLQGSVFSYLTQGPLTEADTSSILNRIVSAIAHMHEHNIVHRDLKPESIFLTRKGDFSSATLGNFQYACRGEKFYSIKGTPEYLAPEVIKNHDTGYTKKCDIWSLGILAFELVTGYAPFYHEQSIMSLHHARNRKFTYSKPDDLPISDDMKDFINLCLTVNADERPSIEKLLEHPWLDQQIIRELSRSKVCRHEGEREDINYLDYLRKTTKELPEKRINTYHQYNGIDYHLAVVLKSLEYETDIPKTVEKLMKSLLRPLTPRQCSVLFCSILFADDACDVAKIITKSDVMWDKLTSTHVQNIIEFQPFDETRRKIVSIMHPEVIDKNNIRYTKYLPPKKTLSFRADDSLCKYYEYEQIAEWFKPPPKPKVFQHPFTV